MEIGMEMEMETRSWVVDSIIQISYPIVVIVIIIIKSYPLRRSLHPSIRVLIPTLLLLILILIINHNILPLPSLPPPSPTHTLLPPLPARSNPLPLPHPPQQPLIIPRLLPHRLFHLIHPLPPLQLHQHIFVLLIDALFD